MNLRITFSIVLILLGMSFSACADSPEIIKMKNFISESRVMLDSVQAAVEDEEFKFSTEKKIKIAEFQRQYDSLVVVVDSAMAKINKHDKDSILTSNIEYQQARSLLISKIESNTSIAKMKLERVKQMTNLKINSTKLFIKMLELQVEKAKDSLAFLENI